MREIIKSTNPRTLAEGGSKDIVSALLAWITNPKSTNHCTVTGGPGAGKTWMLKNLFKAHESFQKLNIGKTSKMVPTGTTHESLRNIKEVNPDLKELRTLYSHLGLVPVKNKIRKREGNKKHDVRYNPSAIEKYNDNTIYVCDESNFIDRDTLELINKWYPYIRIIFVGSENQLGTDVGKSHIFMQGWDNFYLNTSFRASNEKVQAVYDNSELDVINKSVPRFVEGNDTILYMKHAAWLKNLEAAYTSPNPENFITLAYTNKRVFELVGMIREMQGRNGYFDIAGPTQALRSGSSKISKNAVKLRRDENNQAYIPITTDLGEKRSYVGESYEHFEYLASTQHSRRSDEIYPSLVASNEAKTIHGSQGGTWDYTFLDLTNMFNLKTRDMETYRRMKHVAESRHRKKIFVKID